MTEKVQKSSFINTTYDLPVYALKKRVHYHQFARVPFSAQAIAVEDMELHV